MLTAKEAHQQTIEAVEAQLTEVDKVTLKKIEDFVKKGVSDMRTHTDFYLNDGELSTLAKVYLHLLGYSLERKGDGNYYVIYWHNLIY